MLIAALMCGGDVTKAQTVWIGPATGSWTTATNWSGNDIPDTAGENVIIDNNPAQDTTVTYTIPIGTDAVIGSLAVDSGDTLTINRQVPSGSGSATITINGTLSNAGTMTTGGTVSSTGTHGNTFTVTVATGGGTFNTGTLTIKSLTGARRASTTFSLVGNNTNDGSVIVQNVSSQGGGAMRFNLSGSGAYTFTNNGSVRLEGRGSDASTGSAQPWAVMGPASSNTALTLGGTGTLTLASNLSSRTDSIAILSGAAGSMTGLSLTNSSTHTIEGNGYIGHAGSNNGGSGNTINVSSFGTILNDGLIRASRGANFTSLQIRGATANITNSATGRMISANGTAAGTILQIGVAGATFTNNGLLEARAGNSIAINASNVTLNGTIAGAGTYSSSLVLTGSATLKPGDLDNGAATPDGTGNSTFGTLNITGDLTLAGATILDYQLGANTTAGGTYDSVFASGSLTLDGVLNVTEETGFGIGAYRLFSFGSGLLTDNLLTLGALPTGYNYSLDINNAGGYVDLVVAAVPEPNSLLLILVGSFVLHLFVRRLRSVECLAAR